MAQPQPDGASKPRSVEGIYSDFQQRRNGLLLALTTDSDRFFAACNPQARIWVPACAPLPRDLVLSAWENPASSLCLQADNLALYGEADGTWTVDLPAEEVPPELPEPCLGESGTGAAPQNFLCNAAVCV